MRHNEVIFVVFSTRLKTSKLTQWQSWHRASGRRLVRFQLVATIIQVPPEIGA